MRTIAEDLSEHCGHFVIYESSGLHAVTWVLKTNNAIEKAFSALLVFAIFLFNY